MLLIIYILGECNALWGERERSRRQPYLLSTATQTSSDKKKRRTVADSVANVGESVGVN